MKSVRIGDLPASAVEKAVYRRNTGALFIKLNESFHVKCRLSDDGRSWLGDGRAEALDPAELVERID
jgi:hypothetical protein